MRADLIKKTKNYLTAVAPAGRLPVMSALLPQKLCRPALLAAAAVILSLPAARGTTLSQEDINFGDSQATPLNNHKFAVFTFEVSIGDNDLMSGGAQVMGDMGIAGLGSLTSSGAAKNIGDLYYHTGGSAKLSGGATLSGAKHSDSGTDAYLSTGVSQAQTASSHASALSVAPASAVTLSGQSQTFTADPQAGDRFVMNISNFSLSASSILTLSGDANSSFVLNISGAFSVSNSQIVLAGGVNAANVLFNYTGTSGVVLSGGQVTGIILAASASNYKTSNVQLTGGAHLYGEIIADKVSLSGAAVVQGIVSP